MKIIKSRKVVLPVSQSAWVNFQFMCDAAGTTPRAVVGRYVKQCVREQSLVLHPLVTKNKTRSRSRSKKRKVKLRS